MTEGAAIALLGVIGVLGSALVAAGAALIVDLRRTRNESRKVWLWARDLVDHIYRGEPPPPPAPPAGLFT